jgi:hypothetical protein
LNVCSDEAFRSLEKLYKVREDRHRTLECAGLIFRLGDRLGESPNRDKIPPSARSAPWSSSAADEYPHHLLAVSHWLMNAAGVFVTAKIYMSEHGVHGAPVDRNDGSRARN